MSQKIRHLNLRCHKIYEARVAATLIVNLSYCFFEPHKIDKDIRFSSMLCMVDESHITKRS